MLQEALLHGEVALGDMIRVSGMAERTGRVLGATAGRRSARIGYAEVNEGDVVDLVDLKNEGDVVDLVDLMQHLAKPAGVGRAVHAIMRSGAE